jgi:hypothetical protein
MRARRRLEAGEVDFLRSCPPLRLRRASPLRQQR